MAKYKLVQYPGVEEPINIRAVYVEYPHCEEYDNDCKELLAQGFIFLTECTDPNNENKKYAFFIKNIEKEI